MCLKTYLKYIPGDIIIAHNHFGIFHLETSYLKKQLQTPMLKRTYSELNINKFNNMLTATNFEDVLDMNDPELAYSLFMDKYKYCFNECFPEKLTKLKMNKKYVKKEPWMTDDLMIMLKEKSKLYCKKIKMLQRKTLLTINCIYKPIIILYDKLNITILDRNLMIPVIRIM